MKRIIFLALVICAVAMTAQAQSVSDWSVRSAWTGNDLYERCSEDAKMVGRIWCLGYMSGFRDGKAGLAPGQTICVPREVGTEQIRDVVLRALRKKPEKRHHPAAALVGIALEEVWPCPK